MIDYSEFFEQLEETPLASWIPEAKLKVTHVFQGKRHGDLPKWLDALEQLPRFRELQSALDQSVVSVDSAQPVSNDEKRQLEKSLRLLRPWRKGPFNLFGVEIDTEWHSDWKWDRVYPHIESLEGKTVLDIGCGSGYHLWRMLGAGAKLAVGLDPTLLYVMQFYALQKYINNPYGAVLPLGTDDLPENLQAFDTVFSMGLLYHRRAPLDHLLQTFNALKPGGQLVLETLVVDGDEGYCLMPEGRYAKMPNVFFLPTTETLSIWLKKMKYQDVHLCDVNQTSIEEQRATTWMGFESLENFLDSTDKNKTVEGYPAPKRAILTAKKPL